MILVNEGRHYLLLKFGWLVRGIFDRCDPGLIDFDDFLVNFGWVVHYCVAPECARLFIKLANTVVIQSKGYVLS